MKLLENTRELTIAEWDLAWEVFWDTLPYERIRIGNKLSPFGERAWMECINPGLFVENIYILHMGGIGFKDATSSAAIYGGTKQVRHTFIHELTHVWQSHKKKQWVLTRSLFNQACAGLSGGDAYKITEFDLDWNEYNVEQQAIIVESWFKGGMSTEAKFFRYIRNNIRNC